MIRLFGWLLAEIGEGALTGFAMLGIILALGLFMGTI